MIRAWLYSCAFMIVIMISIGGLTRLSDAGLSIVEWKPIFGIIPPITDNDWVDEFSKYQTSPEYKVFNSDMLLPEFKQIFWLEFIHRVAGRLTGLIICLPLIFFYASGKLPFKQNKSYILLPILVIAQGIMGWYMVKSGLSSDPYVSHFRLAAHLMLAIALYSIVIHKIHKSHNSVLESTTLVLIYIQIFLGALVAGLDAGLIYNTFPLMGGDFIPKELYASENIFSDAASVQFMHRTLAYMVTAFCLTLAYKKKNASILLVIIFQVATGITILLYNVPISVALLHQLGAVILLTVVLMNS